MMTWLESCAAWCAGGWKHAEPGLSDLISRWRTFNGSVKSDGQSFALSRTLIRFLFSHRDTGNSLGIWLKLFHDCCLREAFDREPMLSDEALRLTNLLGFCEPG
jgi:DNA helicase II / ATP-dependent DNA helicase PcrA